MIGYNEIVLAFKVLQAYSLVSWQADREAYSVQKLIHAWGHDRLELEQRRIWSLAVLDLLNTMLPLHDGDSQTELRLVPHIMADITAVSSAHDSSKPMQEVDQDHVKSMENSQFSCTDWVDGMMTIRWVF